MLAQTDLLLVFFGVVFIVLILLMILRGGR